MIQDLAPKFMRCIWLKCPDHPEYFIPRLGWVCMRHNGTKWDDFDTVDPDYFAASKPAISEYLLGLLKRLVCVPIIVGCLLSLTVFSPPIAFVIYLLKGGNAVSKFYDGNWIPRWLE